MNRDTTPVLLSRPVKEAIKTALSVTIAMSIALAMDWDKPYWAGFAVAFISLGTQGQSLNKGAMRMCGTLVAIVAAFIFLCWFPQDRWAFMAVVSLYVGFCAYMMTGTKHQYFWYASGFICTVIAADSHDSLSSFQIAVERAQETGTGVLVYSLVSALLWPVSAQDGLEKASRKLFETQALLLRGNREWLRGEGEPEKLRQTRDEAIQLLKRVQQLRNAAESDSYSVWEMRHQWRRIERLSVELMESLGNWRISLPEMRSLDFNSLLPNLNEFESELDLRFTEIQSMLDGQAPAREPQSIGLVVDKESVSALAPFETAAVEVAASEMQRLDAISESLFETVRDLRGYELRSSIRSYSDPRQSLTTIDPDRVQGVFTVLAIYWISFLLYVYVPDIPGKASFWQMSTLFAMLTVMTNSNPVTGLAIPTLAGTVIGGVLYVFVMPHLSGFWHLGLLIFVLVFVLAKIFSQPSQVGLKASLIANTISAMSIKNEQTYSFVSFTGSLAMNIVACGLLVAVFYLPPSPRPEKVFVRLYRRFFRHAHRVISLRGEGGNRLSTAAKSLGLAYCKADVLALPGKMKACAGKIDSRICPEVSQDQIDGLVSKLGDLAFRIRELDDTREVAPKNEDERDLAHHLASWRDSLEGRLEKRGKDPTETAPAEGHRERLAAELTALESCVESVITHSRLSDAANRRLFRLLGSYRGLSEAETAVAEVAERINWSRLREARF